MDITITVKAVQQLLKSGINHESFLRLGVKSGGCAGTSYDAFIDSEKKPHDEVIYDHGEVRVVTESLYKHLFDGLTVDYSDDLIQPGFILKNPNAKQSCGCGASFKTDAA